MTRVPEGNQNPGGGEPQNPDGSNGNQNQNQTPNPQVPAWRAKLAPEVAGAKTLDKFKGESWDDVGPQVLNSYLSAEKLIGGSVRVPGEKATPEEWGAFFEKLGRPKTADDYGELAKIPEGMPWNKDAEKAFLKEFHAAGLTKAQAQRILSKYVEYAQQGLDQQTQKTAADIEQGWAELKQRWGTNVNRNVGLVQRTVQELGGTKAAAALERTGAGNDPDINEMLLRVGERFMEHGYITGDNLGMTTSDAASEIKAIEANKDHPYWKKSDPGHAEAVKKMRDLYALAYPERA